MEGSEEIRKRRGEREREERRGEAKTKNPRKTHPFVKR